MAEVLADLARAPQRLVTLFTDDDICADRDYSLSLFSEMAGRGLQRRCAVQASLAIADDDGLLRALRASGCLVVMVGLESISEPTLRSMRKGVNLAVGVGKYAEKIKHLHAYGLIVAGTFILGADGDTADTFRRTADFVLEAGVDLPEFGLLMPTPGTDVYERLSRERRLLYTDYPRDYARFDLKTAHFSPLGLTAEQAEAGLLVATRAVSSWPVALRRAARTWHDTGSPLAALISLVWTRTSLQARHSGSGLGS